MSIGKKIKQFREMKNFTQEHMANSLGLSQAGYGKIERDQTDISIPRLQQIAIVLDVDYRSILDFDEKSIFNLYNNNTANAVVHNQQYINDNRIIEKMELIEKELSEIKVKLNAKS